MITVELVDEPMYAFIARITRALRTSNEFKRAASFRKQAFDCDDYAEVLDLARHTVNIPQPSPEVAKKIMERLGGLKCGMKSGGL